jgi:NADPH:quinone reductase-like Zn-dependent oxidoreductase
MKAILWTAYGPPDVLQLGEVEKPVPKDNEVLIRIHAATVTAGDCEMRSLKMPLMLGLPVRIYAGFRKPQRITIIGQELAGEIEAVGKDVRSFKPGDQVFGTPGFGLGAYAEYKCMPEDSEDGVLVEKPTNMTYEQAAAAVIGGLEALHFLRQAHIQEGQKVLINGAGGSIGTIGIQLAKHYGAEVIGVDSREKLDMLLSIGADQVIDYTQEDFTQRGESYDVIFDVIGKSSFSGSLSSLNQNGTYLMANPGFSQMLRGAWASKVRGRKVIFGTADYGTEDLLSLKQLIEAGRITTVIDRRFPLEQTAEAHKYVETGRKKGNVIIAIGKNNNH